jgi:hypothetical protein
MIKVHNFTMGILCLFLFGIPCGAQCPPADLTGDCFVDLSDAAQFASQWLTG